MNHLFEFEIVKEIMKWQVDLLPLFIPVLFLFVFLEWRKTRKKQKGTFKFESTVLNISFGLIERVFEVYFFFGVFLAYKFVEQNFGLLEISLSSIPMWIVCMFALDFVIYWYHRTGHTVSFFWAAHVVHHQCEEFNLTVAFRNGIFPHIFRSFYILVLPFLGFPAEMILVCLGISGLWQFFIHTTTVNKMGVLENFMMTPSLHRVHHASNEKYLDKNFGGMFIIWDRLLGTYQIEEEPVQFGIVKPVNTFSLWKAYTHVWEDLFYAAKERKSIKEFMQVWFGKPADVYEKFVNKTSINDRPSHLKLPKRVVYYLISQMMITISGMVVLLVYKEMLPEWIFIAIALMVVFSSFSFCFLLEGKKWTFELERVRLIVLCGILCAISGSILMNWICAITVFYLIWMELIEMKFQSKHKLKS